MNKRMSAFLTILCLLFAFTSLAEEENQVDISFDGYMEAGGMLRITQTDESYETGGLGLIGTTGQTIGDVLQSDDILSVEPLLEGDVFEGWMEVALTVTVDEDGSEWVEYSPMPDPLYSAEELLNLVVPDHNVMYVAKWAGIPAEEYFAPMEEEMIALPSITLLGGEGTLLVNSEEEPYETSWTVATVEPGQTFGDVLALDIMDVVAAEGKMFTGWMVYEYSAETMEISEVPVDEEGVLCFELFEDYHMVLREYTACAERLTTEALAAYACGEFDHVVIATWMTAEAYLALVTEQSDALQASLAQDPLTQTDMNLKSEELRRLWDTAMTLMLHEAKTVLPAAEWNVLMEAQNVWMESTEKAVEAAGKEVEGGSLHALVVNMEAASLTATRVYEIYEMLN